MRVLYTSSKSHAGTEYIVRYDTAIAYVNQETARAIMGSSRMEGWAVTLTKAYGPVWSSFNRHTGSNGAF